MPMVETNPWLERTALSPVFMSTKQPVPYVFLADPSSKQQWPKNAACWSPATPVMGGVCVIISLETRPKSPELQRGSGIMDRGMSSMRSNSSSQSSVWMLKSMVRLALV